MDYYPGYGYRTDYGRFDQEEEFIMPMEDQDDFRKPILPRNRKRWDFDTEDIALEPYGSNVFGSRKAGRYANSNPFEVFRKDTNPAYNKENAYAVDQMYPNLEIEQIMDWTYMKPKVNNNAPIFDHRADNDSQTPRIIKPITRLDSIGGAYMQDIISQENYRDRRWGSNEINKAYIQPRITLRPDVEDIEGPINLIGLCNERERVAKFTAEEFEPQYEQINNDVYNTHLQKDRNNLSRAPQNIVPFVDSNQRPVFDVKTTQQTEKRGPQTMAPFIDNNQRQQMQKVNVVQQNEMRGPQIMSALVDNNQKQPMQQIRSAQQTNEKNLFLNNVQLITAIDVNPMNTLVPKTQLAKDLVRNTKIQPYYTEVQIDNFNLSPATAVDYYKETREIKPYLVTNEAMLDTERPFYLNANQKELRNNYRVFTPNGEQLAIYQEALSPFSWTFDAKTRNQNCNEKFQMAFDANTRMTMPDYLVASAPPQIQLGHVDKKENNLNQQNIFLSNVLDDRTKRPSINLQQNKVKPQIRSTSNENKPIRMQTRILNR